MFWRNVLFCENIDVSVCLVVLLFDFGNWFFNWSGVVDVDLMLRESNF